MTVSPPECSAVFRDIVEPKHWYRWIDCPHAEHWESHQVDDGTVGDDVIDCRLNQRGRCCALDEGHTPPHLFEFLPGKFVAVDADGLPREATAIESFELGWKAALDTLVDFAGALTSEEAEAVVVSVVARLRRETAGVAP